MKNNCYLCTAFQMQVDNPRGRCVLRSGNNTNANYGFVNVNANNAASHSYTSFGSRIAFRGEIEFVE